MNNERINDLVRDDRPEVAAVVREFAGRPSDEQLVYLFRGQQRAAEDRRKLFADIEALKVTKPFREKLYDLGMAGALVSYILFDRREVFPWWR
ncbi:MAG TPA: hypothetical protein VFH61_16140 [Thermoleophilia bacterium]|nr:hypothetical protein [Thermoleophilia bacterium]